MKTFDTTTVGDVMHEGVVTCDVDEPLTSVARTMLQRRIHQVVVWHEPATASDPPGLGRRLRPRPREGRGNGRHRRAPPAAAQRPRRSWSRWRRRFGERPS